MDVLTQVVVWLNTAANVIGRLVFAPIAVLPGWLSATLVAIVTGVLMMKRVQTPFFARNPYLFGDTAWGFTYVVHGAAGVGLVGLVIAHVYFAVRPEKWWITKSMLLGWITRRQYLEHHEPQRWPVASDTRASRT